MESILYGKVKLQQVGIIIWIRFIGEVVLFVSNAFFITLILKFRIIRFHWLSLVSSASFFSGYIALYLIIKFISITK